MPLLVTLFQNSSCDTPMTPAEARRREPAPPRTVVDPKCLCGKPATCYEPASGRSYCYRCSVIARADHVAATGNDLPRFADLYTDAAGVARIDRDRAGGGVVCDECGHLYYDHPELPGATFLTVLCDGSVVKL